MKMKLEGSNLNIIKAGFYSNILMILTSVHHVYGAYIYNTLWRLHVLFLSIPTIILTVFLGKILVKRKYQQRKILAWLYWTVILGVSIVMFGLFEGAYNHLLKDLLFYAGVSDTILLKMFPPPTYEMPNDFLFEFTGVLQAVILVPLINFFIRLTKIFLNKKELTQPT
jgi:hypothetical protein